MESVNARLSCSSLAQCVSNAAEEACEGVSSSAVQGQLGMARWLPWAMLNMVVTAMMCKIGQRMFSRLDPLRAVQDTLVCSKFKPCVPLLLPSVVMDFGRCA